MSKLKKEYVLIVCLITVCCAQDLKVEITPGERIQFKPIQQLPTTIPTCKENDVKINDCIKSAFQEIIFRLKNGIQELNIPSLDPFVIEKSKYQYSQGAIQGRVAIKNVKVFGLSNSIIERVNFSMSPKKINLKLVTFVPKLYIEGAYKGDIKINELKFNPKGFFNITSNDISVTANPEGELYERDGHTFLRLLKFNASPEIGGVKIFATGLFEDPALNSLVLDFANQYWRQIHQALLPEAQAKWESIMLTSANEFFSSLPFDFILIKS